MEDYHKSLKRTFYKSLINLHESESRFCDSKEILKN